MAYNILYSNTFMGANQKPIDPTNWTPAFNVTAYELQVLSAQCTATNVSPAGQEYYSGGQDFTKDQWCSFVVSALPGAIFGWSFATQVRYVPTTGAGYKLLINFNGEAAQWSLFNPSSSVIDVTDSIVSLGDVILLSAVGSTILVQQNGETIFSTTDTTADNDGTVYLSVSCASTVGDTAVTNFLAGSVGTTTYSISGNVGVAGATVAYSGTASGSVTAGAGGAYTIPSLANGSYTITPSKSGYTFSPTSRNETVSGSNIAGVNFTADSSSAYSVPDCRDYATFPNLPVNVNGTLQYTTPAHPSHPAPVDSRKKKPVQSSTLPQNSRTDPPFKG
jgi:hypothetical protein